MLLEDDFYDDCYDPVDSLEISLFDDACYAWGQDANMNYAYGDELAIVPYVKQWIISLATTLDSSFDEKDDRNDVIINSINANCANNMQNPNLGDANFAMSTTYCNDHDWGDSSYDLENLFKPHDDYVCYNIESGFGRVSSLGNNDPTTLDNDQSYDFFIKVGLERSWIYLIIIPLFWKIVNFACMWIM